MYKVTSDEPLNSNPPPPSVTWLAKKYQCWIKTVTIITVEVVKVIINNATPHFLSPSQWKWGDFRITEYILCARCWTLRIFPNSKIIPCNIYYHLLYTQGIWGSEKLNICFRSDRLWAVYMGFFPPTTLGSLCHTGQYKHHTLKGNSRIT